MTDPDIMAAYVDAAREWGAGDMERAVHRLVGMIQADPELARAVARHLLGRAPDCQRVPLVGKVR